MLRSIAITLCLTAGAAQGQTLDVLQEVGNLLFSGKPNLADVLPIGRVSISDSAQCVVALVEIDGGAVWFFLNNVTVAAIEYKAATFGLERGTLLTLQGAPYVLENRLGGPFAHQFGYYTGLNEGLYDKVVFPVLLVTPERMKDAMDRLYAGRCAGKK